MFSAIPRGTVLLTCLFVASKRPLTAWASLLCAAGLSKQLIWRKLLCATTPLREKSSMPLTIVSAFAEELSPMPVIPRACLRGFAAVIDIWALSRSCFWKRRFAQDSTCKAQTHALQRRCTSRTSAPCRLEQSSMPLTVVCALIEECSLRPGVLCACLGGCRAVVDIRALSR